MSAVNSVGDRERREDRMPMRVDQARHQDPPAAIDHPRAIRRRRIAAGDLLDPIALDKEAKPSSQSFGPSIEKQEIREHDRGCGAGEAGCAPAGRVNPSEASEAPAPAMNPRRGEIPVDPTQRRPEVAAGNRSSSESRKCRLDRRTRTKTWTTSRYSEGISP